MVVMNEQRAGDRRQFVQMGLAGLGAALATGAVAPVADAAADHPAAAARSAQPSFLCVYRPGARWLPGKPLAEQPLREHGRYMLELYRRGVMRLAGRFADDSGGAMLFGADDEASAQAIVAADPAVVAQTFTYELRQWAFVDWEARAALESEDLSPRPPSRQG
jgi:uncharacterized protein YciI